MRLTELFLSEGVFDPSIFKAIFVIGLPGAGKNTVADKLFLTAPEQYGLKNIDIDDVHARLMPRRKSLLLPVDKEYEMTDRVIDNARSQWVNNYLGLLILTTGQDADRLLRTNSELKAAGYQTMMLYVTADVEVAWERTKKRNRKVDKEYFQKATENISRYAAHYAVKFNNNFVTVVNNDTPNNSLSLAEKRIRKFLSQPISDIAREKIGTVNNTRR
jgi:dephospho-CoA kinase